jgi:hypothetical protein
MLARMQRKGNSYTMLNGMHISIGIIKNSMEVLQKAKNKNVI